MNGVEHDHALGDLGLVIDHFTALAAASSYAENRSCHKTKKVTTKTHEKSQKSLQSM